VKKISAILLQREKNQAKIIFEISDQNSGMTELTH
jgi:hypothetical protein